ncbi:MAG: hypothetical protein EOM80_08325 [Erysipelotrichia bacterium]|nr:hypothetical protein [Erysipelotrichia bacterium]
MSAFVATWKRKIALTITITIMMAAGGLLVDPAYFNNPLGEGELGVTAEEGYAMPATSEISVVADGIDPIQIDLKSELGDFAGEVELVTSQGQLLLNQRFALRKYPSGFLPNPAKWQSFYANAAGKGIYLLRMTQEKPGKAKVFFYQGPFIMRMVSLPFIAAFIVLIVNLTLCHKAAPDKIKVES